jgi:hypothetical protein
MKPIQEVLLLLGRACLRPTGRGQTIEQDAKNAVKKILLCTRRTREHGDLKVADARSNPVLMRMIMNIVVMSLSTMCKSQLRQRISIGTEGSCQVRNDFIRSTGLLVSLRTVRAGRRFTASQTNLLRLATSRQIVRLASELHIKHQLLQADTRSPKALLEPLSIHRHMIAAQFGVERFRKPQPPSREVSQVASSSILAFMILLLSRGMPPQRILAWPPQQSRVGSPSGITVDRDYRASCTMRILPIKTKVCMRGILRPSTGTRIPARHCPLVELLGEVSLQLPDGWNLLGIRCTRWKTTM